MNVPTDLMYTNDHEWAKFENNIVTIGITDFAQGELGDIIFVELPEIGKEIDKDEAFGTIEAVKTVSDLVSPITGKVIEINDEIEDLSEKDNLLSAEDYNAIIN